MGKHKNKMEPTPFIQKIKACLIAEADLDNNGEYSYLKIYQRQKTNMSKKWDLLRTFPNWEQNPALILEELELNITMAQKHILERDYVLLQVVFNADSHNIRNLIVYASDPADYKEIFPIIGKPVERSPPIRKKLRRSQWNPPPEDYYNEKDRFRGSRSRDRKKRGSHGIIPYFAETDDY